VYSQTGTDISLTANAWNEFEFTAPFQYGGGNLLVITDTKANYTNGGSDAYLYYTSAVKRHWMSNKDTTPPANNATGDLNDRRANIQFSLANIIGVQATCIKPTELSVVADAYSADISWVGTANAASYTVEYKTETQNWEDATVIDQVSQTSATLTVVPATSYQVRVKTFCGETDGYSDYSDVYSFRTPCIATAVGSGFTEDFTTIADYAIPDCWTKTLPHNASSIAVYPAVVSNATYGQFVRFYGVAPQALAMPEFEEDINTLALTFDLWRESAAQSGIFEVGVLSDPTNPATFVSLQNVSSQITVADKVYATYTVSLTDAPSGYNYIAFRQSGTTTAYFYQLDNIVVAPAVPVPVAEFSFEVADLTATFTDESTGEPTAWEWDFGDGETSAEQNPVHTYAVSGTYQVTLTVTNATGESEPVTKTVQVIVSNINNVFAKEVNIYPNPAKDCISLSVSGMEGNISLKITDLSGKTLMTKQFTVNNNIVEKVDISVLKQGIYFISVENKDFSKTQKLTVY
ncbi:MAG: PKD domain-containing protein, partial [Prevotellaceae bacterium]|nr:PKD domain-containing protein [Prevotellaceae bacterium]